MITTDCCNDNNTLFHVISWVSRMKRVDIRAEGMNGIRTPKNGAGFQGKNGIFSVRSKLHPDFG